MATPRPQPRGPFGIEGSSKQIDRSRDDRCTLAHERLTLLHGLPLESACHRGDEGSDCNCASGRAERSISTRAVREGDGPLTLGAFPRMRSWRLALMIAVGIAFVLAWRRFEYLVPSGLADQLASVSRTSQAVDLAQLTKFEWDRVVFLGPYTNLADAERALGMPWPDYPLLGLDSADSFSLIAFANGARLARVERIDRCSPDFGPDLLARPVSRAGGRFRFEARDGCVTMVLA